MGLPGTTTSGWQNQDMDQLQQDQLHVMLRGLLARLQTLEGAVQRALGENGALDARTWDLFSQMVTHDHCELCGQAVWNADHECQVGA